MASVDGAASARKRSARGRFESLSDAAGDESWSKLASYLERQGMSLDLEVTPRRFMRGIGNRNYLLRMDSDWVVLRRPPAGPLPPGANDMAREHRILSRLWRSFPLAPRSFLFCADEGVLGAPFLLMAYRPGRIIGGDWPEDLAPDAGGRIGQVLVETLAAIHRIDVREVGLQDIGRPDGFLERAVRGWSTRAAVASGGQPPAIVRDLTRWLERRRFESAAPTLMHSDFKLDNVIFQPESLEPAAVIDWDMGTRGDPLLDLATLLSYWSQPDDPPPLRDLGQMPTAGHGFPPRREIAKRYQALTGRNIDNLLFYRVLAHFKLGVVFLQQSVKPDHLHRPGVTAGYRDRALGLLDLALEVARGGLD